MPKLLKNQIQIPAVLPNAFLRLTAILTKKNLLEKKKFHVLSYSKIQTKINQKYRSSICRNESKPHISFQGSF